MGAEQRVPPSKSGTDRIVQVWDLPTRLFHWLTVVLVVAAYLTERMNWIDLHVRVGESLLVLVLFRLLWGGFGSETARFRSFVASPRAAFHHLRHLFRREADLQVGHNPAGGWMVLALLALLLIETLTGLYVYNDIADEGPLSEWVPASVANAISTLHAFVWDALMAAVALHVLAIVLYATVKGHNLLRPMLTGRKPLPADIPAPRPAPVLRACVALTGAAVTVALLAAYL